MQNFINFLGNTIRNQNALYLPAGGGKVSFVDVRDIAAVAAKYLLKTMDSIRGNHTILQDLKPYLMEMQR